MVALLHGAIHALGFVKAFGLAEVAQLTEPIGESLGVLWLVAGLLFVGTGAVLLVAPRSWWILAIPSVVTSQAMILTSWSDALVGTVPNVIILAAAIRDFSAEGPFSLRARYRRSVEERRVAAEHPGVVTESDLSGLPPPVARYLRLSGVVGTPMVRHFRARWRGRIRSTPDDPWMEFEAVQHNFVDEPARFFLMDARRGRLPVDVLHAYRSGTATLQVRLLSMVQVAKAAGREMDRAETVTVLNDLCILAPGALVDDRVRWEPVDDHTALASYTVGDITVSASLHFDEEGRLIDFVSDDRLAMSPDGSSFTPMRWSTPLRDYRDDGDGLRWSRGEGRWHPPNAEPYTYLEGELIEVVRNPSGG